MFVLFIMIIWLVCLIVVSLCVIIKVVFFFVNFFSEVWIICFVFVLSVDVVLFKIKIGGFFKNICVIVNCCFCFLESLILCLLMMVLRLFGIFFIILERWVSFMICLIFLLLVFNFLYVIFLWIVLENKKIFCCMILICVCKDGKVNCLIFLLLIVIFLVDIL